MTETTLLAHCGARYVNRDGLRGLAPPVKLGRTHKPIPHLEFAEALIGVLGDKGLDVAREQYAVMGPRDAVIFGTLDISPDSSGLKWVDETRRPSLGFRGGNDQSMKREIAVGTGIFVCDNMCFSPGLISLARKHTIGFDLKRDLAEAIDRYLQQTGDLNGMVERAQRFEVNDDQAKVLIFDAFTKHQVMPNRFLPKVADAYFNPPEGATDITAHHGRLWGLHNAFTRPARELRPRQRFEATAKLGDLLALASMN